MTTINALGAVARAADRRRLRAWLRVHGPVRDRRAVATRRRRSSSRLNKEINAALADPKAKARLAELGGEPLTGSAAEFGRHPRDRRREMGQGHPRRQHQGGSSRSIAGPDAGLSVQPSFEARRLRGSYRWMMAEIVAKHSMSSRTLAQPRQQPDAGIAVAAPGRPCAGSCDGGHRPAPTRPSAPLVSKPSAVRRRWSSWISASVGGRSPPGNFGANGSPPLITSARCTIASA